MQAPERTCPPRSEICGLSVLACSYSEILGHLLELVEANQGATVVTLNLEMVSRAWTTPQYLESLKTADLLTADGMPVVWASHFKRGAVRIPERTAGSDLTGALLRQVSADQIAIIGGESPMIALEKLQIPDREQIFIDNGRISLEPEAIQQMADTLRDRGIRLVFVALGVPKQDDFAAAIRKLMPNLVCIGVGGTFEMIAGTKKRAPGWMQLSGLEWFFRLALEPRRLWNRYLVRYWSGFGFLTADVLGWTNRSRK
jgi:N-acetylglucosaminyldiphosphoundecaprenol N-acetyl-beta-D-mannosaminyltransferase